MDGMNWSPKLNANDGLVAVMESNLSVVLINVLKVNWKGVTVCFHKRDLRNSYVTFPPKESILKKRARFSQSPYILKEVFCG